MVSRRAAGWSGTSLLRVRYSGADGKKQMPYSSSSALPPHARCCAIGVQRDRHRPNRAAERLPMDRRSASVPGMTPSAALSAGFRCRRSLHSAGASIPNQWINRVDYCDATQRACSGRSGPDGLNCARAWSAERRHLSIELGRHTIDYISNYATGRGTPRELQVSAKVVF